MKFTSWSVIGSKVFNAKFRVSRCYQEFLQFLDNTVWDQSSCNSCTIWSVGPVWTLCHMLISDCVLRVSGKKKKKRLSLKNLQKPRSCQEFCNSFTIRSDIRGLAFLYNLVLRPVRNLLIYHILISNCEPIRIQIKKFGFEISHPDGYQVSSARIDSCTEGASTLRR